MDHSLQSQGMGGRAEAGLGEKGGVFISLLKIGNSKSMFNVVEEEKWMI